MEEQQGRGGGGGSVAKGRSCKGFAYFSSILKSKHKTPFCLGIPRTLPQVPDHLAEAAKKHDELSEAGTLRTIAYYYYGCLGYSIYTTDTSSTIAITCDGIKIQRDPHTNPEEAFEKRFTKNANLVASGVKKNLKRVGNYVKEHLDNSLDDPKRPK